MSVSRIWDGSAWTPPFYKYPKIWNGSTWVYANPKIWSGTAWEDYRVLDTQSVTIGESSGTTKVSVWDNRGFGTGAHFSGSISSGVSAIYGSAITSAYSDLVNGIFKLSITGSTNTGWTYLVFGGNFDNKLSRSSASFSSSSWSWTTSDPFASYANGATVAVEFV
jgi:hypothetical protein